MVRMRPWPSVFSAQATRRRETEMESLNGGELVTAFRIEERDFVGTVGSSLE
jgi:hypothetical protein